MLRRASFVAVALTLTLGFTVQGCEPPPNCGTTPQGMRALPCTLYGVTFDNDNSASQNTLNAQKQSLTGLPHMPTARIVFDEGQAPAGYTNAVNQLQPVAFLLGEILDSSYLDTVTVAQYRTRAQQYVTAFGGKVDLWEIGNEVNGNWTGPYTDVGQKISAAFDVTEAAGKRSALTLWYNAGCGNGPSELSPEAFSSQYVDARVRANVDLVTVSYYETQCKNIRPSAATLKSFFERLHAIYPSARLGFGEIGLPKKVTSQTLSKAQSIATYYYGLDVPLSYYAGFGGYWYFAEDAVPSSKPMHATIAEAMQ